MKQIMSGPTLRGSSENGIHRCPYLQKGSCCTMLNNQIAVPIRQKAQQHFGDTPIGYMV